jgi:hypothetical protein
MDGVGDGSMTRGARAATMLTVTSQHRGRARKPRTNDAINLKAEIKVGGGTVVEACGYAME